MNYKDLVANLRKPRDVIGGRMKENLFAILVINAIFLLGYFYQDLLLLIPLNAGIIISMIRCRNDR